MTLNATGIALSLVNRFAGSTLASRYKLRKPAERLAYHVTRTGFRLVASGQQTLSKKRRTITSATDSNNRQLFDLSLSEEQRLIIENTQRLAHTLREQAGQAENAGYPTKDVLAESEALGLNLFVLPEAWGGISSEAPAETMTLITEQLAWGDMGQAMALLAPTACLSAISRWGGASLQAQWLPRFAEGQFLPAAMAIHENNIDFSPEQARCTATRHRKGYRLNGQKTLVPLAQTAEFFLVSARINKNTPALFLVERETKGLQIDTAPAMGLRSAGFGTLTLSNVQLSPDACLDHNFQTDGWLSRSRIAASALACGTSQAVVDFTIPYCNERQAFGEPISHRQGVAFLLADMATELDGMRLMSWRAASRCDHQLSYNREAWLAHTQCSDKGMMIGTHGVQLLGGHGFVKEYPVERWYRDLRAISLLSGSLLA
ncbi:acyl-CoA dehydrogenase family protein [Kistimonas scapharcae]|uniref:Acyl-CoA dehydrogenase family protein n=1 Tax=Kistimonas scapharcae TaxID=1036133 RepID=A0ABP8UZZ8_9GAMM